MRVLAVLLLSVLAISCGDEEDIPQVIEQHKPETTNREVEERVPIQYEIPEDIPINLAEHFAGLQEHMTVEEWHLVLNQVNKACNGSVRYINHRILEDNLSDNALQALQKAEPLLPRERNTDEGRIRALGGVLPDVHFVELVRNGTKVVHHKHAYTVIITLDGIVDHRGTGSGTGVTMGGAVGSNPEDTVHVEQIVDKIRNEWTRQWIEEFHPRFKVGEFQGKPIELRRSVSIDDLRRVRKFFNNSFEIPKIPNNPDLLIIYIDEAGDPLNRAEVEGVWFDREDAPRATQEQLAEYNRIHSPDAYDCVGE